MVDVSRNGIVLRIVLRRIPYFTGVYHDPPDMIAADEAARSHEAVVVRLALEVTLDVSVCRKVQHVVMCLGFFICAQFSAVKVRNPDWLSVDLDRVTVADMGDGPCIVGCGWWKY